MAEYTLKDMEVVKDMPGYAKGPAKVLMLTLEDPKGEVHQAEMFTMASTTMPVIEQKIEGEIESSDYGPKFRKGGGQRRGPGGGKSPAQEKRIVRQHSEHMALLRERNLIAAGRSPLTGDELRGLINWFDGDVFGKPKGGVMIDGTTSDVPIDMSDTPFEDPK